MTLATWRGVTGHNIPPQGVNSTCKPVFESVSNGFLPKKSPFIFLPLTYNGEVAKLTRPRVTKFRDIHFIDTGTDINCWMFQGDWAFGVAMMSIQTVSEVRSLDVTCWPDLEWPGSETFTCAENPYEQIYQKRRRICEKPEGRRKNAPSPSTARVKR